MSQSFFLRGFRPSGCSALVAPGSARPARARMSWYNEEAYAALRARGYSSFSGNYGYLMYGDYDPRDHAAFYNRSRDPWDDGSPFKGDGTFYMAAGSEQHHRALPRPFALLYSMLRLSNRCVRALCCARTHAHHRTRVIPHRHKKYGSASRCFFSCKVRGPFSARMLSKRDA